VGIVCVYQWEFGSNNLAGCRRNPIDLVIHVLFDQMSCAVTRAVQAARFPSVQLLIPQNGRVGIETVIVVLVCAYEVESYTIIEACVENVPSC
jgi:hypothetical protein